MVRNSRREFLGDVGRGMLLAGLGTTLAGDLGLAYVRGDDSAAALSFGEIEPLVALMQDTPPAKLTAILVDKLKSGTSLKTLVAAGALSNARTFGGQDYIGFHTFMALAPAYRMAMELPTALQPLPVLKVLFRNANRIQEFGGRKSEVLHPVTADPIPTGAIAGEYLCTRTWHARETSKQPIADAFACAGQSPRGRSVQSFAVRSRRRSRRASRRAVVAGLGYARTGRRAMGTHSAAAVDPVLCEHRAPDDRP